MGQNAVASPLDGQFLRAYDELQRMMNRSKWSDREIDLVATLLDNVSYWLLYVASNYQHFEFDDLELWRGRFFEDPILLLALDNRLATASVSGEKMRVRDGLMRRAELAMSPEYLGLQADLGREYEQLASLAAQADQRQVTLAARLGFDVSTGRAKLGIYSGLRAVASAQRRSRIHLALAAARDQTLGDVCDLADRIAAHQRKVVELKGFTTPLEGSLEESSLDEWAARDFVDDFLTAALKDTSDLAAEISDALGEGVAPPLTAHAGRYLAQIARGRSTPGIPLQSCLDLAFDLARQIFGVACSVSQPLEDTALTLVIAQEERPLGRIQINLLGGTRSPTNSNTTVPGRTLQSPTGRPAPIAMISCRFSTRGTTRVLNLQNAHSLLHEFGHALNHVLLDQRVGSSSGLDHLPAERLELMSMWFERWTFSEDLANRCSLSDLERGDLAFAVQAKAIEYRLSNVERGAIAGIDMLINGYSALGVGEAYQQLCDRHPGLRDNVLLGDLVGYLGWPMLREKPGAYFSYLWSAAESAAIHLSGGGGAVGDNIAKMKPLLLTCFEPSMPSSRVSADAAISYYRQPVFSTSC